MTSKEFVLWLKGFTQGIEDYNITPTPTQWNVIKGKLSEVNDGQPIGSGIGVPNLTPNGTATPHFVTPSIDGFAVTATPGYGSITYNPSTSTLYGYPSGSAWHYTSTSTREKPEESTPQRQLLTENHD